MAKKNVSISVVRRLPRYYRFLDLLQEEGKERISSQELAHHMGITASQIRQDLNCFGGFGQQGYGYHVANLKEEVRRILGLAIPKKAILVGMGKLGQAIVTHMDFAEKGFDLVAVFDQDPALIGSTIEGFLVSDSATLESFCAAQRPDVAILCVPKMASEGLVARLVAAGVGAFWNFSHFAINVAYPDVVAENVHLGDSLMTLSYGIRQKLAPEDGEPAPDA